MFNNLVVETTRLGIEVKNLRMLVESLSTRLDFDERRARALEGVVQYRPGTPLAPPPPAPVAGPAGADDAESPAQARRAARPARIRATAAVRGGVDAGAAAGAAASKAARRVPRAARPQRASRPRTTGSATTATTADQSPARAPATMMVRTTGPTSRPGRSSPSPRCPWRRPRRRRNRRPRRIGRRRIGRAAATTNPLPSRRRRLGRTVKLAVVVQRYGADISGGAELHARYVAEMLARRHHVEVLTTCAHDYVTWKAHYAEGTETVNGVPVRRFPVARERDPQDFGQRSTQVFERRHSVADEMAWLDSEGPTSPALIDYIGQQAEAFDFFLFFSYRYYHAWHGVRRVPNKAILVPTAERDAAIGLSIFAPVFRAARALMYNSPEERAIIQAVSGNTSVPGVVVGIGSDLPRETAPDRFRRKYDSRAPSCLRRAHRREQGLRRAVRLLRQLPAAPRPAALADPGRHVDPADSAASAHPASRLHLRPRQVRRHRRLRGADHAVAASRACRWSRSRRGAGPAGAGQRPVRRAARAVHPEPRRALLRRLPGVRRSAVHADVEPAPAPGVRRERAPLLRAPLRVAGHPAQVPRTCSGSCRGPAPCRPRWRRSLAGWRGSGGRWHRHRKSSTASPRAPCPTTNRRHRRIRSRAARLAPALDRRHVRRRSPAGRPSAAARMAAAAGHRATVRIARIAHRAAAPASRAAQAGGGGKAGAGATGAPAKNGGGQKGSRDRQDGRRGQNRQGRQRRPPRRNG